MWLLCEFLHCIVSSCVSVTTNYKFKQIVSAWKDFSSLTRSSEKSTWCRTEKMIKHERWTMRAFGVTKSLCNMSASTYFSALPYVLRESMKYASRHAAEILEEK